jgi:alpha-D-ribose 1-methylphosphonate 5-triphosphate synthase subunit PhnH
MQVSTLEGGFQNAPIEAASAFRQIMTAMARPGTICDVVGALPPAPMSTAAGVVVLTLCDPDTPVFLAPEFDRPDVRAWITFHTGAPFVAPSDAAFALGVWDELSLDAFGIGTPEYPDRAATLIVEMAHLAQSGAILRGPGIEKEAQLSLPDLAAFQSNAQLFPLGLDFIFTCESRLAALPRTTKVS